MFPFHSFLRSSPAVATIKRYAHKSLKGLCEFELRMLKKEHDIHCRYKRLFLFFRWVDEDLWLINPEMCLRLAAVRT